MPDNYDILNLDYETVDNISKTLDEERVVFENELSLGSSDSLTTIYINGDMDCMVVH